VVIFFDNVTAIKQRNDAELPTYFLEVTSTVLLVFGLLAFF
jgi:hypothetical protein